MTTEFDLPTVVYNHFQETAEWPRVAPLQIKYRAFGNIAAIAAELGREHILCEESRDGVCRLTLRGYAACAGAQSDVEAFLAIIRAIAKHYIETGGTEEFAYPDIAESVGLSTLQARRVGQLIRDTHGFWTSMGSGPLGLNTIAPNPDVWYHENVRTVDEFYSAIQRANDDAKRAAQGRFWFSGAESQLPAPAADVENNTSSSFIADSRIAELRTIKDPRFDLRRLIAMCEELSTCAANQCVVSTVLLTRAIIDHVPPIFGVGAFAEVANNYPGPKSFKQSMRHLEKSARGIADGHLHVQIRPKEVLPTSTQVDFSRDLDVLLSEIVRILS